MDCPAGRILVVEDDVTVRNLLAQLLRTEGYEVLPAGDAESALAFCREELPALALVDVGLGTGPDGLDLTRRLRQRGEVPVILVTGATEPDEIRAGLSAGADLYVEKPFCPASLLARVDGLLERAGARVSAGWSVGDLTIDWAGRTVTRGGTRVELQARELDLLVALARRPGQVVSKDKLLAEVWAYRDYDHNVVERRVSSLRRKLERYGPRLIHTAWGSGYVLRAE